MTHPYIAPIVEGHGEVQSVRGLLRRIVSEFDPRLVPVVNPPIRVKAGSFLKDAAYFDKHVALACAKASEYGGFVLILLDCDDDCPARLGPELSRKAREVRSDVPVVVVLAHREYETWFVTAAESLGGRRGLPVDLKRPDDPEAIRDAKGWLGDRMPSGCDPVVDQPSFTEMMDFEQASGNASFRRLLRVIRAQLVGNTL